MCCAHIASCELSLGLTSQCTMPSASLFNVQDSTRIYGPIRIPDPGHSKLKRQQLQQIYDIHHSELVVDIRFREAFGLWVYRVNVLVNMPTCFALNEVYPTRSTYPVCRPRSVEQCLSRLTTHTKSDRRELTRHVSYFQK